MSKKHTTFEKEIDGARPLPASLSIKMWGAVIFCAVIWVLAILNSHDPTFGGSIWEKIASYL